MQATVQSLQQQQQEQQQGGGGKKGGAGAPPAGGAAPAAAAEDLGSSLPVISSVLLALVLGVAGIVGYAMQRDAKKQAFLDVSGTARGRCVSSTHVVALVQHPRTHTHPHLHRHAL